MSKLTFTSLQEKIEFNQILEGSGLMMDVKPLGSMDAFIGRLDCKSMKIASIDEIDAATARGWAGQE